MSLFSYNKANKQVYDEIKSRLLSIGIYIEKFIDKADVSFNKINYDVKVHDTTLDGIEFNTVDEKKLKAAFYKAKDLSGNDALASLKSTDYNWALKCSFSETPGTGWREIWRPIPYKAALEQFKVLNNRNRMLGMRLTSNSIPFNFTSLHLSLKGNSCKIHIDKNGFVMKVPGGIALSLDFYQHTVNELLFKTDFRNWLVGKRPNTMLVTIVKGVIDRTSFVFPNTDNGFAGLKGKFNSMRKPKFSLNGLKHLANIAIPIGISADLYNGENIKVKGHKSWINNETIYNITIGGDF